jgi:ZIP family zinc transporter
MRESFSADLVQILIIAGPAAIASPLGGLLALWRRPTTLFVSVVLGYAGGVLLGTISFEMLPQAQEFSSLPAAVAGFLLGFGAVYAFDLYIHHGVLAGEKAEQRFKVRQFYRTHPPRGDEITVLAGGTSSEELIEGLAIGVGAAIKPGLGLFIALAILIDNVSEALSIGLLIRDGARLAWRQVVRRTLEWTGLIGAALLGSALAGWFFLRGLPLTVLGFLLAAGGGGMFYLTVTDLLPEAEERHYQQSAALAVSAGFMTVFILGQFY